MKPGDKTILKTVADSERQRSGLRIAFVKAVHFVPLKEQSLRSAPSGRNSEQGLAPRSKYSRRYAAEYFGYRKSLQLREQRRGRSFLSGTTRFLFEKEMGL